MSWRQWAQGEIVEAGDLQDLIQNQVIQSYETELQRDNTLGANVIEGMFCYIEGTGNFQLYDGFNWVTLNTGGDITSVTAGTALTGGGTSGDVTLNVDLSAVDIPASQITDLTATATELNTLDGITSTTAELNFTDGVTSNIQTQLDDKQQDVITTQGDLVTGDVNGDPVRVAIGTADQVLTSNGTALTWADATGGTSTGGLNYIINGAFDFWQRGDAVSQTANQYTSDRWFVRDFGQTWSVTEQVSDLIGFNKYARVQRDAGNAAESSLFFSQPIETSNALQLAGQNVVLSFYAQKGADFSPTGDLLSVGLRTTTADDENPIAGGTGVIVISLGSATLTSSWQRFTFTGTIGSTARSLGVDFNMVTTGTAGANDYYEIAGVQLEAGSTATPFKRNAPNLQGELAACQRYFQSYGGDATAQFFGSGLAVSNTIAAFSFLTQTALRATPTVSLSNVTHFSATSPTGGLIACTNLTANNASTASCGLTATVGSGLSAGNGSLLRANLTLDARIELSAEL